MCFMSDPIITDIGTDNKKKLISYDAFLVPTDVTEEQ